MNIKEARERVATSRKLPIPDINLGLSCEEMSLRVNHQCLTRVDLYMAVMKNKQIVSEYFTVNKHDCE